MPRTSASLSILLLASTLFAQSPASQTKPDSTPPTIQARTNLVVVDIVVTDHSGKNVHGLQQSDFVLTEKGTLQKIRSFDEHSAPTQPPTPEPMPVLPPGIFTNYEPAPQSAALNVLLLDTLNTPLKDQTFVHQQLLKFLRTAPPGNRFAIFGLTTHLILLQGFTSDPELLRAALDKKSIRASPILDDAANGGSVEQLSDTMASAGALADTVARVQQFEAENQSFQIALRTRYTLDAMNTLARYLSGLPGRKNLIWFSGSFPLNVLPNGDLLDPFAAMADMSDEARDTASLLTRSQVAVYPVDARGLFNAPMYDASQRGPATPQAFSAQLNKFNQQTADEQATMRLMAEQTGGRAFVNTNGLREAVDTVVTTGANFYTLSYTPADTHWDGKYRKIGLKLQGRFAGQSLNLAYRRGYFAVDPHPATPPPRRALNSTGDVVPATASPANMRAAMMRGAPDPTEVLFKARILPAAVASAPAESSPDPDTRTNSDPKLAHGPWRRYVIDGVAVPAQLLTRHAPDGNYIGTAEFVVHCYDRDGTLITAASGAIRLNVAAANAQRIQGTGIPFHQVISVPAKGEYFLRIGVHDLVGDRVGALEVPVSTVKNLPPLPSPASSQPPASTAKP